MHNRNNPNFSKDITFPNGKEFKLAMRQHAINGEFKVNVSHSDTTRYIATCASVDCKWRIYAVKLRDSSTFTVYLVLQTNLLIFVMLSCF